MKLNRGVILPEKDITMIVLQIKRVKEIIQSLNQELIEKRQEWKKADPTSRLFIEVEAKKIKRRIEVRESLLVKLHSRRIQKESQDTLF